MFVCVLICTFSWCQIAKGIYVPCIYIQKAVFPIHLHPIPTCTVNCAHALTSTHEWTNMPARHLCTHTHRHAYIYTYCRCYIYIVFLCRYRFETCRKKLILCSFRDFINFARVLLRVGWLADWRMPACVYIDTFMHVFVCLHFTVTLSLSICMCGVGGVSMGRMDPRMYLCMSVKESQSLSYLLDRALVCILMHGF